MSVNKQTGKTYRSDRHSHHNANTEVQQPRSIFKKKAQFASSWWKQNRPADKNAKGTEAYLAMMKAYKAQQNPILPIFHADPEIVYSNLTTPYSYMRSLVIDDLKVILSGNDLTSGVKPGDSPTEGGGQKPVGGLDG